MYVLNGSKWRKILRPAEWKEVDWTEEAHVRYLPGDSVHNTNHAPEEEWYEEALVAEANARIHNDAVMIVAQYAVLTCKMCLLSLFYNYFVTHTTDNSL